MTGEWSGSLLVPVITDRSEKARKCGEWRDRRVNRRRFLPEPFVAV